MFAPQDNNSPPPMPGAQPTVFDVDMTTFDTAVMQASQEVPILVDFWAPWCGPCKQLGPVLEAAVQAAGGAVRLAKVNIDQNQQLAAALQVQSVPTVFAIFKGQPVDAFMGARPPGEIQAFIDKVIQMAKNAAPGALDIPAALKAADEARLAGDVSAAHRLYTDILTQDQNNAAAYAGLIRVFIAVGQAPQARHLIENAPEAMTQDAAFRAACTALELAETPPDDGAITALSQRVTADENDHLARFELAKALFAAGRGAEAIDALLVIIRRDRAWEDDKARKELLKFFEALGPTDPVTIAGRRKLSSVLFS